MTAPDPKRAFWDAYTSEHSDPFQFTVYDRLRPESITALDAGTRAAIAAYIEANGRDPVDVASVIAEVVAPDLARLRDGIRQLLADVQKSADTSRPSKKTQLEDGFALSLSQLLEDQ